MEPTTLLLLGGAALLFASRKKKGDKPSGAPECPPGFVWDPNARSCVPATEGPPQLHITGDCEAWQMLPSGPAWFAGYAQPKFEAYIRGIQAEAKGMDDPVVVGPGGSLNPHDTTLALLAQAPIAFPTPEFQNLGSMCPLPASMDDSSVPPAMVELYKVVFPVIDAGLRHFNATNEPVLPIPA